MRKEYSGKVHIEEVLLQGKSVQIKPEGYSMYPLLVSERDEVILAPVNNRELKRGDIVLYRREGSILVCHRIWKVKRDGYYMVGDNQSEIEGPLKRDQIKGIVIEIIRNGKHIKAANPLYRGLTGLWLLLRPARPFISKIVARIRKRC